MDEQIIERAVEAAAKHVPTRGMSVASGVTCECGYWTGSEKPGVTRPVGVRSGSDGLDWHRATVMLAEVEAPIRAQALRAFVKDYRAALPNAAKNHEAVLYEALEYADRIEVGES